MSFAKSENKECQSKGCLSFLCLTAQNVIFPDHLNELKADIVVNSNMKL